MPANYTAHARLLHLLLTMPAWWSMLNIRRLEPSTSSLDSTNFSTACNVRKTTEQQRESNCKWHQRLDSSSAGPAHQHYAVLAFDPHCRAANTNQFCVSDPSRHNEREQSLLHSPAVVHCFLRIVRLKHFSIR
eukprot:GHRQ01030817.1.p1 GENE.GHRQ01030817.1~~GHRQ01030817.1.p1  ORF type:complete len:133 (+),score=10.12 GHRQ01030817.1:37-435(+)